MAETFEVNRTRRLANWLMTRALRLGVPVPDTYLLVVKGRRSGKLRTTPVTLVHRDGQRFLVAPYGTRDWVLNARAAGEVTLSLGRRNEHVTITESPPDDAAPILKQYIEEVPIVRPHFDATVESPAEEFRVEAERKPVFRLG